MRVSAHLFASHRDLAGSSTVELDLPDPATVADVIRVVKSTVQGLTDLPDSTAVAVNRVYARPADPVCAGDEVALIPPVAGG